MTKESPDTPSLHPLNASAVKRRWVLPQVSLARKILESTAMPASGGTIGTTYYGTTGMGTTYGAVATGGGGTRDATA